MARDNYLYIEDILKAGEEIASAVKELDREGFIKNRLVQGAVLYFFIIIGEAAGQVSGTFQKEHPEVPWQLMKTTRNIIIHEYFGVKLEIVWDTIKKDLPALKQALEKLEK